MTWYIVSLRSLKWRVKVPTGYRVRPGGWPRLLAMWALLGAKKQKSYRKPDIVYELVIPKRELKKEGSK